MSSRPMRFRPLPIHPFATIVVWMDGARETANHYTVEAATNYVDAHIKTGDENRDTDCRVRYALVTEIVKTEPGSRRRSNPAIVHLEYHHKMAKIQEVLNMGVNDL